MNKFQKVGEDWREVLVDVDESGDKLRYVISRNATPSCVLLDQDNVRDLVRTRRSVEMSPAAWNYVKLISERIVEEGGAALIADYGHDGVDDVDTLRAFRHHKQVLILTKIFSIQSMKHHHCRLIHWSCRDLLTSQLMLTSVSSELRCLLTAHGLVQSLSQSSSTLVALEPGVSSCWQAVTASNSSWSTTAL